MLIDVSQTGVQAGFCWPVALTSAAWENCVAWTEEDTDKQICQDVPGRRWDVLFVALWRLSALPRYLQAEDVERIIESCDLTSSAAPDRYRLEGRMDFRFWKK